MIDLEIKQNDTELSKEKNNDKKVVKETLKLLNEKVSVNFDEE